MDEQTALLVEQVRESFKKDISIHSGRTPLGGLQKGEEIGLEKNHATIYDYPTYAYTIGGGSNASLLYFSVGGHEDSWPVKDMSMPPIKDANSLLML